MRNNNEYDYLTLYAKKIKVKEVIEHYQIFGWELVNESENYRYEDILDLSFVRPHKIKNKDELQLQQVYMEEKLNEIGKCEKHKNSKSVSFGLCIGVGVLLLLALSINMFIKMNTTSQLVFAIIFASLSVILLILELVFLPKIYKKENLYFKTKTESLNQELINLFNHVKKLSEVNNE